MRRVLTAFAATVAFVLWPYSPLSSDFHRTNSIDPDVARAVSEAPESFVDWQQPLYRNHSCRGGQVHRVRDRRYREAVSRQRSRQLPLQIPSYSRREHQRLKLPTVWDWIAESSLWPCEGGVPNYGSDGNPKRLCGFSRLGERPCTVYSIGCNGDVLFEQTVLAKHPGCEVHIFDPTLSPIKTRVWRPSASVPPYSLWYPRVRGAAFHSVGLSNVSGVERGSDGMRAVSMRVTTLQRAMQQLGHKAIDVLKLDVEGTVSAAQKRVGQGPVSPF